MSKTVICLAGGAQFLRNATANSQFVLLGESHNDRLTPAFTSAMFELLHTVHKFNYYACEQDPLGISLITAPPVRGDLKKVAAVVRKYPYALDFVSDEELGMLANISRLEADEARPIWGLEQAFGATIYLEALRTLAPDEKAAALADKLLLEARRAEAVRDLDKYHYMGRNRAKRAKFEALAAAYHAAPGSHAKWLLDALLNSDEIYSYYTRAEKGEVVGLYNNTVREAWFKQMFMRDYHHAMAATGKLPKVLFKFGDWHLYHGRGPSDAFTIGNFAHEFAIANGHNAFGILVLPLGAGYIEYKSLPVWIKILMPASPPAKAMVIDLRPFRAYAHHGSFDKLIPENMQIEFQQLVYGYEAIVILPGSTHADFKLTGFKY